MVAFCSAKKLSVVSLSADKMQLDRVELNSTRTHGQNNRTGTHKDERFRLMKDVDSHPLTGFLHSPEDTVWILEYALSVLPHGNKL